ncbi:MAG: hypothetical protein WB676_14270 [Bryobacteraceae bacterium]
MKATVLYRIAGSLLIAFFAGNSYFFVRVRQTSESMNVMHFGHRALTYAQVFLGLGLFCSLCALFGAYLAWHLGALARTTPQAIGALGWVLFSYQVIAVFVTWIIFSGLVVILSAAIAICTAWATWLVDSAPPAVAGAK